MEQKVVDPEAELSNVQRLFKTLAPMCSVEKRAAGIPQLAPQEKQLNILATELKETQLCISIAKKGQHAVRDSQVKRGTKRNIIEYEAMENELRDEKAQQWELDLLNHLSKKKIVELCKLVPTEAEDSEIKECTKKKLRQMENRLELATKRFCVVNTENKKLREEIDRLLVERNSFNLQWNRTIGKLVKGKEYLMDIFEIANNAFSDRDECCRKLEALKWKGLFQLNRDIMEMQSYESDLNHLAKLEEFLRVKGSRRFCEADEKEDIRRLEEIQKCEQQIAQYDELLDAIFAYAGSSEAAEVVKNFNKAEIENFSTFVLLCEVLQESVVLRKELEVMRQRILDQRDINKSREDQEARRLEQLKSELEECKARRDELNEKNIAADATIFKLLKGIDELVKLARCDSTPLLALLGNHKDVTRWNVSKFLKILECEVKSLIEVVYGSVKPPAPTPKGRKMITGAEGGTSKLVADPYVMKLQPNKIENLVPYQPCAYCVEDYIMNFVFETPAVPADKGYVQQMFQLENVNTKFGIFTLTIPAKRHPFSGKKD